MRTTIVLLTIVLLGPAALIFADEPAAGKPLLTARQADGSPAGWTFFSAEQGVTAGDAWQLGEDGVLVCRGKLLGYLATRDEYQNFELQLQWRRPADQKPGKGGVLIRMTGPDKIWPRSLEAQLNAGGVGDFWGLDGFRLSGPAAVLETLEHPQFGKLTHLKTTENAEKPAGQWNQYVIHAEGNTVTLLINGKQVNQATRCDTMPGKILLTAEGDEIHFRNVEITPLGTP